MVLVSAAAGVICEEGTTWTDDHLGSVQHHSQMDDFQLIFVNVNVAFSNEGVDEACDQTMVMRRVRDLPVEDELMMCEREGPMLEEIVWKKY